MDLKKQRLEREKKFIIENYRTMKYADIARHLGISPGAVNSRIAKLREAGVIRKKNRAENKAPRRTQPVKITYKGNPNRFEINKKYKITHWSARKRNFTGIYRGETKRVHIFESDAEYKECFLKTDFMTGEYKAEEIS